MELSPKLYPILLTQIMTVVNSFFTPSGQVSPLLSLLKVTGKRRLVQWTKYSVSQGVFVTCILCATRVSYVESAM